MSAQTVQPSFAELFTPKLVTVLSERYGFADLKADVLSGLTVAVVALPLSMAIAIASGVTPDRGLYTSIFGGFIVSAIGGSRFQIGGPAGAFIVLVAATVAQHGVDGLILATLISGIILSAVGLLRIGTFIKFIPYPVTVGFTAGIAVIIFASQIKELLGLTLEKEPGPLLAKLYAIGGTLPTSSPSAIAIAALTVAIILSIRRWRPHWPAFIIAVGISAAIASVLGLSVGTIGTRFGGIPDSIPAPHLPLPSLEKIVEVLPSALSFALLGCIESLLSAVVADSMTGRRHRSNCELVAQGLANIVSSLFGGICVTGNIARTATNVRSGARGPVSGMMHSAFLLIFVLIAAPLAAYIPLAALAAVLAVVTWNMVERHAIGALLRASRGEAAVCFVTFLVTIFRDLTTGIVAGFILAALLFLRRMAQDVTIKRPYAADEDDKPDQRPGRTPYDAAMATDRDVLVYRLSGAFFFGAAANVGAVLDRIAEHPRAYVIDFSAVPLLDSSGAATLDTFVNKARRHGAIVYVVGAARPIRRTLLSHGLRRPHVRYKATAAEAVASAHSRIAAERNEVDTFRLAQAST
jgi:SulP family sulfate permease